MSTKEAVGYFPRQIRVSLGSAIVLGMLDGKLDASPTTAYLMTYRRGKCTANCGFCPQARESRSKADMLSRISWPVFPTQRVLEGMEMAAASGKIRRVCIQALNYLALIKAIKPRIGVPISISCQPKTVDDVGVLASAGVERIGIPLDAANEELFDTVKGATAGGPYAWERQFRLLKETISVIGEGKVSTHLIVGLGETEQEMVNIIQKCADIGVLPALFAFTPIIGTALEDKSPPLIQKYRRIQVARSLILNGAAKLGKMSFDKTGRLLDFGVSKQTLLNTVLSGDPFLTSGCPNCNRPYYNEKPSGPIYNYPKSMTEEEIVETLEQLGLDGAQKH
jgi:biotin synthase-related radical SAM superfamily protein